MPIRINLLAEQQAEEEARRQNPVKKAVLVVVLFALVLGTWGASLYFKSVTASNDLASTEAALHKMDKEAGTTRTNMMDSRKIEQKMDALAALATNRFLWAPQLDVLQRTIPPHIQLTRVKADQRYTAVAAEKSADPKKPGKKASVTEKIVITIDGRDYQEAEQFYNKFKEQLLADAYFRSVMTNESGVVFKGFSGSITDGNTNYIKFNLDCAFPDRVRTQ